MKMYLSKIKKKDLITLREGISSYPIYYNEEDLFSDRHNKFIEKNEILLITRSISNKNMNGYECLLNNEIVYISDLIKTHITLKTNFCFVKK